MTWVRFQPRSKMLVLDKIFPEGIRIPDYFEGKNIVHLPTVKCHIYTTTTGAMKNAFGGLLNTRRHYTHSWIHETLVDLLAIQKEIHSGIFAVMDGTTAGNGPGPRTMYPEIKNVVLASGDQVAIDAVAARLMGFDPLSIGYIRLAHEAGLGIGDPRDIELVGDTDLASHAVRSSGSSPTTSCSTRAPWPTSPSSPWSTCSSSGRRSTTTITAGRRVTAGSSKAGWPTRPGATCSRNITVWGR